MFSGADHCIGHGISILSWKVMNLYQFSLLSISSVSVRLGQAKITVLVYKGTYEQINIPREVKGGGIVIFYKKIYSL